MGKGSTSEWRRSGRGQQGASKFEGRRGLIARAARTCLERKGVAKTSIADITREVDITRELFYYYFPNKASVISTVIDGYVSDARALFERSLNGASDTPLSLLTGTVSALRIWLSLDDDMPVPMLDVLRESGDFDVVLNRVAKEALVALRGTCLGTQEAVQQRLDGQRMALLGAMLYLLGGAGVTDEEIASALVPLFPEAETSASVPQEW